MNLKTHYILIVLVFACLFSAGCHDNTSPTPPSKPIGDKKPESGFDKTLVKVNDLIYKDKKYEEAMTVINNELSKEAGDDRQEAMVMFRRAEILAIYGKYDESEKILNKSQELDLSKDQRVYLYSTIAALYSFSNRKQEALEYVNKSKELAKDLEGEYFGKYEFYSAYGTVMSDKGKYPEAIEYLEKALELRPESESLMIELAFAYLRNNQRNEAKIWGEKWISTINPDKASLKDKEEILDRVEEMIKYYIIMEEYDKAFALAKEAERDNKGDCSNDMELFYTCYYSGKYDGMGEIYKRIQASKHSDKWEKDIARSLYEEVKTRKNKDKRGIEANKSSI